MSRHSRISSVSVLVLAGGYLATLGVACSTANIDPPVGSDAGDESTVDAGLPSQDSHRESRLGSPRADVRNGSCPPSRQCSELEARTCRGGRVFECQSKEDECRLWMEVEVCGEGQICTDGACQPLCSDQCPEEGRSRCLDDRVQTCGHHDGDPCLEWDEGQLCDRQQTCSDGGCIRACSDQCERGTQRCADDLVQICLDGNDDGCLEWVEGASCQSGTTCSEGACVVDCQDQCQQGEMRCAGADVQTCDNHDSDGCLEWQTTQTCGDGQTCSEGQCVSDCSDQCSSQGETRCSNDAVQTCDDHDGDTCLEWGGTSPCGSGQTCSGGQCVSDCSDACSSQGNTRCNNDQVETCDDHDGDTCLEWGGAMACGSQETCSSGSCTPANCSDQCSPRGSRQCAGHGYEVCDTHDSDACLEFGPKQFCSAGELCQSGTCQTTSSPPSQLVISEVLYDSQGADQNVFIEIAGAPNTDISGFELVGLNGNGGSKYADIVLRGKTDPNGIFLVVYDKASSSLNSKAQQISSEADLQNGPDSVQLRWGSTTVDAVGYGDFTSATFKGEPSAHPDVSAGQSLARYGTETDTDDNSADFYASDTPTPGKPNAKSKP